MAQYLAQQKTHGYRGRLDILRRYPGLFDAFGTAGFLQLHDPLHGKAANRLPANPAPEILGKPLAEQQHCRAGFGVGAMAKCFHDYIAYPEAGKLRISFNRFRHQGFTGNWHASATGSANDRAG